MVFTNDQCLAAFRSSCFLIQAVQTIYSRGIQVYSQYVIKVKILKSKNNSRKKESFMLLNNWTPQYFYSYFFTTNVRFNS